MENAINFIAIEKLKSEHCFKVFITVLLSRLMYCFFFVWIQIQSDISGHMNRDKSVLKRREANGSWFQGPFALAKGGLDASFFKIPVALRTSLQDVLYLST